MSIDDDIPFVLLTERLNLWENVERTQELIDECRYISGEMSSPLRLIVIDTYAKATIGSDELSGKEMSIIMDRMERINRETGAAVLLVDHLNASGLRVRGVAPKTANIDAVLICRMATVPGERKGEVVPATDQDNRKIREITNDMEAGGKVKNGAPLERPLRFVLRGVSLGHAPNGKEINSCVLAHPAGEEISSRVPSGERANIGAKLSVAMKALQAAVEENGRRAPAHVPNAPGGTSCVTLADWRNMLAPLIAEESEDPGKLLERAKKARDRAAEVLYDRGYIKKHGDWVWRTGKKVPGLDRFVPPAHSLPERRSPDLPPDLIDEDSIPF
jgi:hypothetical protein